MDNDNKIIQPLILFGITLILMFAVSFIKINEEVDVLGIQLQEVDILYDLKEHPSEDYYYENNYNDDETTDEEVQLQNDNLGSLKYNTASISLLEIMADAASNFISYESAKIGSSVSINELIQKREIEGNVDQLKYFFDALKNSKSKKVRIAHYGDSQIEGDLVTGAIRDEFQKKFGGQGVGYLALTSQDRMFRITTDHQYPDDTWETASIFVSNRDKLPVGIGGEVFVPKKSTWVSYETRGYFSTVRKFESAHLFYSDAKSSSLNYSFGNGSNSSAKLYPGNNVKEMVFDAKKSVSSIKIDFPTADQAYFYGVSLEGGNGIYIDNLPLRGNTGEDLQKIPIDKLKDFQTLLDYKLILLQFGKNAMGTNSIRYEREMVQAIEHLKKAFPNTSFLLISVQDSGFKTGSRTTGLLSSQIRIAKKTDIAFWNLFEAMGGKNSMSQWVKSNPPLASADHTHFNHDGARKLGEMIFETLMDSYNNYK